MSKNINQIFIAAPITTNLSTDLMYFGRSPYGATDDHAMTFANFSAQFTSNTLTNGHIFVGSAGNVATDVAMSGDATIANTGALTLANTAVTPAAYTVNGQALFTVDSKGRITLASNATITAVPSGSAGGDLSGTYPNPSVVKINGVALGTTTATSGNMLLGSGTQWVSQPMSGDATINASGALTLANTAVTPAAYTVNGQALFTVDSKGRITLAANATITAVPSGSAGGDLGGTYPNPSVLKINGVALGSTTATAGNLLIGSGTQWVSNPMSGDATINASGALTLSNTAVTPAAYTVNGQALFTVDAKGRVTAASSVTISGTVTNVNQTTSSATLAANSRYATNNGASLVTYTIPAGAAVGDTFIIVGGSSGGWTVAQPASVQIHLGSSATTSGVVGSLSSSNQYDCLTITCVASNVFTAYGVQGNITVV